MADIIYIYGGYILTGGTLNDGNPWRGINVMLAEKRSDQEFPVIARVHKGVISETLLGNCKSIPLNSPVTVSFVPSGTDKNGNPIFKLSGIQRYKP